ncbi:hypothetical protein FRC03_006115 [Tulasnella sp. 419]|nr:hypothetical protein FRC03_006115 [Tulasnella sp. 419]
MFYLPSGPLPLANSIYNIQKQIEAIPALCCGVPQWPLLIGEYQLGCAWDYAHAQSTVLTPCIRFTAFILIFIVTPYYSMRWSLQFLWYCGKPIIQKVPWSELGITCPSCQIMVVMVCKHWFWILAGIMGCAGVNAVIIKVRERRWRAVSSSTSAARPSNTLADRHQGLTSIRRTPPASPALAMSPLPSSSRSVDPLLISQRTGKTSQTFHKAKCSTCSRTFGATHSLQQHQVSLRHIGIQCSCTQTFATTPALGKHLSNHISSDVSKPDPARGQTTQSSRTITCAVCLSFPEPMMATACGHLFCRDCITRCITTKSECPTCRRYVAVRELRGIYV